MRPQGEIFLVFQGILKGMPWDQLGSTGPVLAWRFGPEDVANSDFNLETMNFEAFLLILICKNSLSPMLVTYPHCCHVGHHITKFQ